MILGCAAPRSQIKDEKVVVSKKEATFDHYYREGRRALKNNHLERAIKLFSEGISIDNSVPDIYISRGIASFRLGEYAQSHADFNRVLSIDPDNKNARKWLGKIEFYRGDFDSAYNYIQGLDRKDFKTKEDLEWYNLIRDSVYKYHLDEAESAQNHGDYEQTEKELNLCRWIKPEEAEPICRFSELYISRNEPWLSLRVLNTYSFDNESCILFYKALTEFILSDFDESMKTINNIKVKFKDENLLDDLSERFKNEQDGEIIKIFKEISVSATLTRSEMAFLNAIRIAPHLQLPANKNIIVTDIGENPLKNYIYFVLKTGLMDIYPNHTFKPAKIIRRQDFAVQIENLLDKVGIDTAEYITATFPVACEDLSPESNYYDSAQKIMRLGLIQPYSDNTFRGEKNVSGNEAIFCFDRLKDILRNNENRSETP